MTSPVVATSDDASVSSSSVLDTTPLQTTATDTTTILDNAEILITEAVNSPLTNAAPPGNPSAVLESPATGGNSSSSSPIEASDPIGASAFLKQQLQQLLDEALKEPTPLMKQVYEVLKDPKRHRDFPYWEAGLRLFNASVVLHLRTDQVWQLILNPSDGITEVLNPSGGIKEVEKAFRALFQRPIIEPQQEETFKDPHKPGSRAAFDNWAHALWGTIQELPMVASNVASNGGKVNDEILNALVEIFNHEKGYNRAIGLAQEIAQDMAGVISPPKLAEVLTTRLDLGAAQDSDTVAQERGMWLYDGLLKAKLISPDSKEGVSWEKFNEAASQNWTTIAEKLGNHALTIDAVLTATMETELKALSLVS